ncbi:MAG: molybdopterin-dependent oxidoreductase [Candidatus Tectomicrobia bacterium]|uniref:Molybdopterin-dependent oxidoreductase n=1 Tax=Tectimicrobiota bacterium TaxID=2528274 RepID=A0A932M075_UNCTE|nr:molybdopterin-dependent oxidoreductase [Candidatus Tectomicrobia bacterium]
MNARESSVGWSLSRRTFLKATGALGAALALRESCEGVLRSGPARAAAAQAQPEKETVVPTICGGCHQNCGMLVHVRGGRVVSVEGNPDHPMNSGDLCPKAQAASQILYAPDRLKYPLLRAGKRGEGKWKRISWDEALDFMANKLKEVRDKYGPMALAMSTAAPVMQCSRTTFVQFPAVYGTPNRMSGNNCYVNRMLALVATFGYRAEDDYDQTRLILLWGGNPLASMRAGSYAAYDGLQRPILDAIERGAKLIVIDPIYTDTAAKAQQWIPIRPGTDGALALAMLHVIINEGLYDRGFVQDWTVGFTELTELVQDYPPEKVARITSVPAETIRSLAREYAITKPALIHEANAWAFHTNGTQTCRAIACLMAVTGNLDAPGGPVCFPGSAGDRLTVVEDLPPTVQVAAKPLGADKYRLMPNGPSVFDAMSSGKPYPIKALIVFHSDPIVVLQDGNRQRDVFAKNLDFLAVIDIFHTPTTQMADIVLPDTTFLERLDYRHHPSARGAIVALRQPVVKPMYESLPGYDIELKLAARMGFLDKYPWKSGEEMLNHILKPSKVTVQDLRKKPVQFITGPMVYKKYEKGLLRPDKKPGFATPSGKVELSSSVFQKAGYDPLPRYIEPAESPVSTPELAKRYPLIGMSRRSATFVHSKYRNIPWLREIESEPFIRVNPEDAAKRGIADGNLVIAETKRGQIRMRAKVTSTVTPGVVLIDGCWWKPENLSDLSWTLNALIDMEARDPIGNLATLSSFLCEIKKA